MDSQELKNLSKKIDESLNEFKNDHSFKDHVTLARIKNISLQEKDDFLKAAHKLMLDKKEFLVNDFVLYRSTLLPNGPKYDALKRFSAQE